MQTKKRNHIIIMPKIQTETRAIDHELWDDEIK